MLHDSILVLYSKQKHLFRRLITLAFTFAGVYWLVIYGFRFTGMLTDAHMLELRGGQTLPYFILLTIWGIEYLRESKRLQAVILRANQANISPEHVTSERLNDLLPRFAVLRPMGGKSWIATTINIVGLALAYVLISLQYRSLIVMLASE